MFRNWYETCVSIDSMPYRHFGAIGITAFFLVLPPSYRRNQSFIYYIPDLSTLQEGWSFANLPRESRNVRSGPLRSLKTAAMLPLFNRKRAVR
jgi:hypothetical protein